MFHRASISSPVFRKPLTGFGGTVYMKSNRLSIPSLESRLGRKGKLLVKGNLPLRTSEAARDDKIELKCDVLEVHAKNILRLLSWSLLYVDMIIESKILQNFCNIFFLFIYIFVYTLSLFEKKYHTFVSGQVNSQLQITGSVLQPIISGSVKLSNGEVYLPHDGGDGDSQTIVSNQSTLSDGGDSQAFASRYISQYFGSRYASLTTESSQSSSSGNTFHISLALDLLPFTYRNLYYKGLVHVADLT